MSSKFKLIDAANLVQEVVPEIEHAKQRVYVLTTVISEDKYTSPLFSALRQAGQRGLEVVVSADSFTFTEIGGHFHFTTQFSPRLSPVIHLKKSFKKSGVRFSWLGNNSFSLLSDRTHAKWLVIDDTVYTFGGVNLYANGLQNTDFMFKVVDADLANQLIYEQKRILAANQSGHGYRSHSFPFGDSTVLVDGGFIGDSVIYRHASKLIDQASSVVYVSQYCPTGKLARLLRKKPATIYFNPWQRASSLNALLIHVSSLLTHNFTTYTGTAYLHCKFLLCTMPDGSKVALTGSHNFVRGGAWLGTREIALETSDPTVIAQLERFIKNRIA